MSEFTKPTPAMASVRTANEPLPDAGRSAGTPHLGMTSRQAWVTMALAVLILIPSMYGFVGKFVEFVHIYRGASGGEFNGKGGEGRATSITDAVNKRMAGSAA